MLQTMRDLAKSWVFKSLMMFLIVSFGIWGIGDIFRGNPQQRAVAKAGSIEITVQELEREFQFTMPEARKVYGPDLTAQQARQQGVLDRALGVLTERAVFTQNARKLGLDVGDRDELARVSERPDFRNPDGSFDFHKLQQVLDRAGMSERFFLDSEEQDAERHLITGAIADNVLTPKTMLDDLTRARGGKRILEVLTLNDNSVASAAVPTDDVLREYHKQHGEAFTAPEYRAITVATLAVDDVMKDIAVSDADLKAAYDGRGAEITEPERRDIVQAVTQDEAKAKALASSAQSDGNLSLAAKSNGMSVVALDSVDEKTILPELYTTVFGMDEGKIAGPVKSPLGWHVIQLKKIHLGGKPTFEAAKETLRDMLKRERAADEIARLGNQLDDALAANKPLDEIAASMKLRIVKIPAVDGNGKNADGKAAAEIPAPQDVLKAAFGQAAGETSQVIDDRKGNYVVVKTDDVTPSQVRPFEQVAGKVAEAWKAEQQAKTAVTEINKIAASLRDGKDVKSYAARSGVDIRVSKPISLLGDTDKEVPASAIPDVLKMKKGDVITASSAGKHYALRLAEIVPADTSKPDEGAANLSYELDDRLPLDVLEQYSNALHKLYPVRVNADLMDMLRKQGG